jgi:hypothetical protein
MQLPDERLDLLLACLHGAPAAERITALRSELLGTPDALEGLLQTAARRQVLAPAIAGLARGGVLHPAAEAPAGTPRRRLAELADGLAERRGALREGLVEIIGALNDAGIEPLVLKGAVSLLDGEPAWRFMRDLDLAVAPEEAERAEVALRDRGFATFKEVSATHHHLDPLARDDVPGPVELHTRLCGRRARRVLDEARLQAEARATAAGGLRWRRLRPAHALLYGLVHHHFENRGAVFATISLKGLLEFADDLGRLDEAECAALAAALAGRPRLAAGFELWAAMAERLLGIAAPAALTPGETARRRAGRIGARLLAPVAATPGRALAEEIAGLREGARRHRGAMNGLRLGAAGLAAAAEIGVNRIGGGRQRELKSAGILDAV